MNPKSLKEILSEVSDLDLLSTKDVAKAVKKWLRIRRNFYARNGNFNRQREAITRLIAEIDGTFSFSSEKRADGEK